MLGNISLFVKKAAREAGLDEDAVYAVELAVDEACSNVIEHAYEAEGIGNIHCRCVVNDKGLLIEIRDTGKPFDPKLVPLADTTSDIWSRKPGGVGLFYMEKMMDEVQFEFTPQGNILRMVKKKPS